MEIINKIKEQLKSFEKFDSQEIGWIRSCSREGIVRISGLDNILINEIVIFENNSKGLVLSFDEYFVYVVMFKNTEYPEEGSIVKRTHSSLEIPCGNELLGKSINAIGECLFGENIKTQSKTNIKCKAPSVTERKSVTRALNTGNKTIDVLIPIGLGQRELIIGDRQSGKTSLAIDTIINQTNKNVKCIYVAIGKRCSDIVEIRKKLHEKNALNNTIIINATASESSIMQYLAPYTGCAIGQYFMKNGEDCLIVYDDLSKHAVAYRELSLLLGRSPGREAYPGDIFYIHSKLLEGGGQLNDKLGGGSLTALPIIETQEGEKSAYIPTNVISITDGQIFLNSEMCLANHRPAIDIGASVTRVGSATQHSTVKKVAGSIKLQLSQFKELLSFSKISSDIDENTKKIIEKGSLLSSITKQKQYTLFTAIESALMFFIANNYKYNSSNDDECEKILFYIKKKHPLFLEKFACSISSEVKEELTNIIKEYANTA